MFRLSDAMLTIPDGQMYQRIASAVRMNHRNEEHGKDNASTEMSTYRFVEDHELLVSPSSNRSNQSSSWESWSINSRWHFHGAAVRMIRSNGASSGQPR